MYSWSNNHLKAGDLLASPRLRCFCVTLGQLNLDADKNDLKLNSFKCLAELPICRSDVIGSDDSPIASADLEGESLAIQIGVALPILSPVAGHCLPTSVGTFDRNCLHIACASYVGNEHQIEVGVPIDRESNSTFPHAWYSSEHDWNDATSVYGDLLKSRLCHVEVLERWIAPSSIVVGKGRVRGAQVSSSNCHSAR